MLACGDAEGVVVERVSVGKSKQGTGRDEICYEKLEESSEAYRRVISGLTKSELGTRRSCVRLTVPLFKKKEATLKYILGKKHGLEKRKGCGGGVSGGYGETDNGVGEVGGVVEEEEVGGRDDREKKLKLKMRKMRRWKGKIV
ncbi:hypothetical protein PIB30_036782 [Stylosanthes scabra]|uniref:Uncharacterized protein n=1 Tax=Stylosanthes scabra TaxID=79078 RepID=A0ABU6WH04_9FABA|nr:hypothetical protein [Stylosanthes scabra]